MIGYIHLWYFILRVNQITQPATATLTLLHKCVSEDKENPWSKLLVLINHIFMKYVENLIRD